MLGIPEGHSLKRQLRHVLQMRRNIWMDKQ